jgi:hypothetical protein
MKNLFRSFYRLTDAEYASLLTDCYFVIDASFLFSIYRLPTEARKELIAALKSISDRLWLPYQAALEYQRNRLTVIAVQNKKFSEVRNILSDTRKKFRADLSRLQLNRRHSVISPEEIEKKLDILFDSVEKDLTAHESKQHSLSEPDPLQREIEELFSGKIGSPPSNQAEIDAIYTEAKARYAKRIPPGYLDTVKATDKQGNEYTYGGIVYELQYGDYVIWKQLLAAVKSRGWESVVLLTDDVKEDWWWFVGEKKIGPRPELRDEISRVANVKQFHMYDSEQFLSVVAKQFGQEISKETIQAAKNIMTILEERRERRYNIHRLPTTGSNISEPEEIIEELIPNFVADLVNNDEKITSIIAGTNAYGFGLDTYDLMGVHFGESNNEIYFKVKLEISGTQDEDKPLAGDSITVKVSGVAKYQDNGWAIENYEISSWEVKW